MRGTSGDTKPTNVQAGTKFLETDTFKTFYFLGGVWTDARLHIATSIGASSTASSVANSTAVGSAAGALTYNPIGVGNLLIILVTGYISSFNNSGVNQSATGYLYVDGVQRDLATMSGNAGSNHTTPVTLMYVTVTTGSNTTADFRVSTGSSANTVSSSFSGKVTIIELATRP